MPVTVRGVTYDDTTYHDWCKGCRKVGDGCYCEGCMLNGPDGTPTEFDSFCAIERVTRMGPGRPANECDHEELVGEFELACRGGDYEFAPEYRAEIVRRLKSPSITLPSIAEMESKSIEELSDLLEAWGPLYARRFKFADNDEYTDIAHFYVSCAMMHENLRNGWRRMWRITIPVTESRWEEGSG